jgi:hypothetical protein
MSEYNDIVTRNLLALTAPDDLDPRIDRGRVREMLAECWALGVAQGVAYGLADPGDFPVNPFRVAAVN